MALKAYSMGKNGRKDICSDCDMPVKACKNRSFYTDGTISNIMSCYDQPYTICGNYKINAVFQGKLNPQK